MNYFTTKNTELDKSTIMDGTVQGIYTPVKSPILKSIDVDKVRKFLDLRRVYEEILDERGATSNSVKVGLKRAIDPDLLNIILKYEMKKKEEDVSEEELLLHLQSKLVRSDIDYLNVNIDQVLAKVRYDLQIDDVQTRVSTFFLNIEDQISKKYGKEKVTKELQLFIKDLQKEIAELKNDIRHIEQEESKIESQLKGD